MMRHYHLFILTTVQVWITTATKILYVSPDNSTNVNCPSQPCATLSQYLLDNGTLPVVSNVEYHFLPGEHHVPANMILQNLYNLSIIGTVNNSSSPVVLVGCSQSYVINITKSFNITVANVMLKQCHQLQFKHTHLTNLLIDLCYSCTIENVTFINLGLTGKNLIGNSYLSKIMIKLENSYMMAYCQGISLIFSDHQLYTDHKGHLIMDQVTMSGRGTGKECYNNDPMGIYILIVNTGNLTIIINNSLFYKLDHSAVSVSDRYIGRNTIIVANTTFEKNSFTSPNAQINLRPLIDIALSHVAKLLVFKNCTFKSNVLDQYLISIIVTGGKILTFTVNYCNSSYQTNISFEGCQFTYNKGGLITVRRFDCEANVSFIGPSRLSITEAFSNNHKTCNLMYFSDMNVYIIGPVMISSNHAWSVIELHMCDVTFSNSITFKSNRCRQVIRMLGTYIKVKEYTNITLTKNILKTKLIETDNDNELYPLCIFQFVTLRNISVSLTHYSINLVDNFYLNIIQQECLFPYDFTAHCKWLPTAAFHEYKPEVVYQQIIKSQGQNFAYHKICHCPQNRSNNCSIDTFGPVYPGQMLQVDLCTPCNDQLYTLYAEVNNVQLPNTTCKVVSQTDKINTISNYSKQVSFNIVSEATSTCELFLTASSYPYSINEAFYVLLLPCPFGFTLQSGVCSCDPILSSYIDKCYIDHSTIRRPANTWITAHTQTNDTKYLISDCPMDYCLPYSSNVNLLYPDSQCQFNRTAILCSQCQHHLSMVFGSSRCMECTNLHILIIIIVIVAGIVLVILLYLLNLTVTIGTINGIIFYTNVVSINDSVFLLNDNVFKPLRVFISFVNLDLGIETCFYNGMDSYAKKWLHLFFPFYLIIIAISIIIASRYSSRILRLTYTRSLPVLATLFLLSYTGVLRTVLTVLFSYSTITHLPSGHQQIVWSIDASVPLFGLKFTILFITCLVLFLLLIPFNITLLFTRYLLRFRLINHFKPILDAFQGSYKDRYYYWVAVHMTMRSLFFAMYAFQANLKLILSTILLIIFSIYSGYIHPHKNKLVNIQELLLLLNLTIMYAVSYQYSESVFSIVTNIMISLAFIQFCTIVLYHFLTYTCHYNVENMLQTLKHKLVNTCHKHHLKDKFDTEMLNIPECTYNYTEYQDGLVSDDFK